MLNDHCQFHILTVKSNKFLLIIIAKDILRSNENNGLSFFFSHKTTFLEP